LALIENRRIALQPKQQLGKNKLHAGDNAGYRKNNKRRNWQFNASHLHHKSERARIFIDMRHSMRGYRIGNSFSTSSWAAIIIVSTWPPVAEGWGLSVPLLALLPAVAR